MKKTAKRRRSKQQVIADRENARRQEELVQSKLAKYDALEQEPGQEGQAGGLDTKPGQQPVPCWYLGSG